MCLKETILFNKYWKLRAVEKIASLNCQCFSLLVVHKILLSSGQCHPWGETPWVWKQVSFPNACKCWTKELSCLPVRTRLAALGLQRQDKMMLPVGSSFPRKRKQKDMLDYPVPFLFQIHKSDQVTLLLSWGRGNPGVLSTWSCLHMQKTSEVEVRGRVFQ